MVDRGHFRHELDQVMGGEVSGVHGTVPGPGAGGVGDRYFPEALGEFRVDVSEDEDEIVVVADLPGDGQGDTTIGLLSPTHLWIMSIRGSERSDPGGAGTAVRHEQAVGRMHRVVALPHAATTERGRASQHNGVLEIRLKKVEPERSTQIPIG